MANIWLGWFFLFAAGLGLGLVNAGMIPLQMAIVFAPMGIVGYSLAKKGYKNRKANRIPLKKLRKHQDLDSVGSRGCLTEGDGPKSRKIYINDKLRAMK